MEQLHKIFKLCGSPSEEFWRTSKLPHATSFKPQQPYLRHVRETFKDFPPPALTLLDHLLSVDPANRGTATSALESEVRFDFFLGSLLNPFCTIDQVSFICLSILLPLDSVYLLLVHIATFEFLLSYIPYLLFIEGWSTLNIVFLADFYHLSSATFIKHLIKSNTYRACLEIQLELKLKWSVSDNSFTWSGALLIVGYIELWWLFLYLVWLIFHISSSCSNSSQRFVKWWICVAWLYIMKMKHVKLYGWWLWCTCPADLALFGCTLSG